MKKLFVDIHVLQILPPSNVNRDDTGAPKTAIYGGARRARVSSQAWKRAMRLYFREAIDTSKLGVRSLRIAELVSEEIRKIAEDIDNETANEYAKKVLEAAGLKFKKGKKESDEQMEVEALLFLGRSQISELAQLAIEAIHTQETINTKVAKDIVKDDTSIDVALFGRMIASAPELNIDASSQVAHAISVNAVDNEFDFYTAVDDAKEDDTEADAGAGMLGTMEFNSSTLYRYATVNMHQLALNIGNEEAALEAVKTFLEAFTYSMPTGKQNSYANKTLPNAVLVSVRSDQPINLVGAFEMPIKTTDRGTVYSALEAMSKYSQDLCDAFGKNPLSSWIVSVGNNEEIFDALGSRVSFDQLLSNLDSFLRETKEQR